MVRATLFQCCSCRRQTSATAGTIFQDTRKPLVTWFRAMWYVTSQKNGASALGLQRVLGLGSYQTAWTMLHRFRRAMVRIGRERLKGLVEIDEAYIGGLERNKHMRERLQYKSSGVVNKTPVIGMRERGGRTKAVVPELISAQSLERVIQENVDPSATIHTDEFIGYRRAGKSYRHEKVNHNKDEYSRKGVTTNGIESVFAVLKRGLHGVFHGFEVLKPHAANEQRHQPAVLVPEVVFHQARR